MRNCLPPWKIPSSNWERCVHPMLYQFLLLFLFSISSTLLFAQGGTFTGRVASGDTALSNVTIQVKGTNTFTQTDENGRFAITAPSNATLIFSSVGFTTQEVRVGNQSNISIQLQSASQQLEQVVVVGYGTQRKATFNRFGYFGKR